MKTPSEARKWWAEELKSGKYKQGSNLLEYQIGKDIYNCCLGVACRLFIKDGGELIIEKSPRNCNSVATIFDQSEGFLPIKVQEYLGIKSTMGRLKKNSKGEIGYLTHINDGGTSFSQIAKIIEDNKLDTLTDESKVAEPPNNSI